MSLASPPGSPSTTLGITVPLALAGGAAIRTYATFERAPPATGRHSWAELEA